MKIMQTVLALALSSVCFVASAIQCNVRSGDGVMFHGSAPSNVVGAQAKAQAAAMAKCQVYHSNCTVTSCQ